MDRVVERPAALDVHKAKVTACVRGPDGQGGRLQEVREFRTTVRGLLELRDWLAERGVSQVAMEATGVYWKPVWAVLEDEFELLLCNAAHVRNVPGRKTDVGDAQWLCRLLEFGLLSSSFVAQRPVRELRELTRRRRTLVKERSQEANRLHKALEDTGIKLDCVATDILGMSGRAMLAALLAGQRDPVALADLARTRLRSKRPELIEAFEGMRFSAQHALLIGGILRHIDFLDQEITALADAIQTHLAHSSHRLEGPSVPFDAAITILCSIPGIAQRGAELILGEIGTDMTRFPTSRHFASWAAQCPGNHQSAGTQKSGRTRHGPAWLDSALHDAAMGALRAKDSHFDAKYRRIKARAGHMVAIGAVKHSLLIAIYHMLKTGELYHPPTPHPDAQARDHQRATHRLTGALQRLGYDVTLTPGALLAPTP